MTPFERNFEHNFTYEVSIQNRVLIEVISRGLVIAKTWSITNSYIVGINGAAC